MEVIDQLQSGVLLFGTYTIWKIRYRTIMTGQ